jgi:O-methyltransferase
VGLEKVKNNFKKYGLLSEKVIFVQGNVCETSLKHPETPIAILRLDVDLYDPTTVALQNLFPRIPSGGYVIVDDWQYEVQGRKPAQEGVADYLRAQGRKLDVIPIDDMSVYFVKE